MGELATAVDREMSREDAITLRLCLMARMWHVHSLYRDEERRRHVRRILHLADTLGMNGEILFSGYEGYEEVVKETSPDSQS